MSRIENWKIMSDISDEEDELTFIKTGFKAIDDENGGLLLSTSVIVSGTNGSAKSTGLGQIALNIINRYKGKYKVGFFSGELTDKRFKRWLYLQASGKNYNKQKTDSEENPKNYYYTPNSIKQQITGWITDNLYLYENEQGFKIEEVGNNIYKLLKSDPAVKIIIIDNLMTLSLGGLSTEKYEAQKQMMLKMCQIGKQMNVVIIFVCHPTKIKAFIRKEDISGSSDLTNAVDGVWIFHRNTTDFKVRAKEYFGWSDSHPIFGYDNIIELVKDRELGAIEKLCGFYFEIESKRFLNYKGENVKYGWSFQPVQQVLEEH